MRKVILVFCVAVLASCGEMTQNGSVSDSLTVVKTDSNVGINIDSVKSDSVKVDSVKLN